MPLLEILAPGLIGGAVSGVNQLLGYALNRSSMKDVNKTMLDNSNSLFQTQLAEQRRLNANNALIQRQSLAAAGFNPNVQGGYPNLQAPQGSTPSLSAAQADMSPVTNGFLSMLQLAQQAPLLEAQSRKMNADAKRQEIENSREVSKDSVIYNDDIINNFLSNPSDNNLPELKITPVNLGTFEARKSLRMWRSEVYRLDADDLQNLLRKKVADGQISNNGIVQAFIDMPKAELDKLIAETSDAVASAVKSKSEADYYDAQTALANLQKQMTENGNIHNIIEKYFGEGVLSDVLHVLVMLVGAAGGRVSGNVSVNKSKSNSNVTSRSKSDVTSRSTSDVTHHYHH